MVSVCASRRAPHSRRIFQHGIRIAARPCRSIPAALATWRATSSKRRSDLGVPIVGVGLLYQQGYFRQTIDADGIQGALYPYNSPAELPITPVRDQTGSFSASSSTSRLQGLAARMAGQHRPGNFYLLDSNDGANMPFHRGITSELYGGGPELRLMQELVLGVGGWRLLRGL